MSKDLDWMDEQLKTERAKLIADKQADAQKLNNRISGIDWEKFGDTINNKIGQGVGHSDILGTGKTSINVSEKSAIGDGFTIGPWGKIPEDVVIGTGFNAGHHLNIQSGAIIGDKANFGSNVVVNPGIKIGNNVTVAANTQIIMNIPDGLSVDDKGVYKTTTAKDGTQVRKNYTSEELAKMPLTDNSKTQPAASVKDDKTLVATTSLAGTGAAGKSNTKIMPVGKGHSGDEVTAIQNAVVKMNLTDKKFLSQDDVDGEFGPETANGLLEIQKRFGLKNKDGVFGDEMAAFFLEKGVMTKEDVAKFKTIPSLPNVAQSTSESPSATSAPKQKTAGAGVTPT